MRLSRPKGAQDPRLSQWHTPVSGRNFQVSLLPHDLLIFLLSFAEKVIKAAKGEKGIVEPTFIYLPGVTGGDAIIKETGVDYFSVPVELGVRLQQASSFIMYVDYALALWSGEGQ